MVLEPHRVLTRPPRRPLAIGEVVHYNVLEGLTKINARRLGDAAAGRELDDGPRRQELHLQAAARASSSTTASLRLVGVKFSFERAKDDKSTNKAKEAVFDNISSISAPDPHTVILTLNNADGNFLFRMGENTAVILHPEERGRHGDQAGRHRALSRSRTGRRAPRSR